MRQVRRNKKYSLCVTVKDHFISGPHQGLFQWNERIRRHCGEVDRMSKNVRIKSS